MELLFILIFFPDDVGQTYRSYPHQCLVVCKTWIKTLYEIIRLLFGVTHEVSLFKSLCTVHTFKPKLSGISGLF